MRLWVKGEGDVVAALMAEGWDFQASSQVNSEMLKRAKERGDKALVLKLTETAEEERLTPEERMLRTPRIP